MEEETNIEVDNSKIEEILKIEPENMTAKEQAEFFNILKESQLFMPIEVTSSIFDNIENAKVGDTIESEEPFRFKPIAINGPSGKAIPLFTSKERMEEAGANVSCIAIFTEDLAGMLEQTGDEYSEVAINPFTTISIGMPLDGFLNLF